jgi:hypothetical protein
MALWSSRWVADSRAADDGNRAVRALDVGQAAVAPLLGPFLGPFARHWQPCGLGDGHGFLVGVCAVLLGSGLALQLAPLPSGRGASRLRLLAWGAGWTVWFGAAWWSMLHWFG